MTSIILAIFLALSIALNVLFVISIRRYQHYLSGIRPQLFKIAALSAIAGFSAAFLLKGSNASPNQN